MEQLLCPKCSVFPCAKMRYNLSFPFCLTRQVEQCMASTAINKVPTQTEQRSPHPQCGTVAMASGSFPVEKSWCIFYNSESHTDLFLYLVEKFSWEEVTGDVTSVFLSFLLRPHQLQEENNQIPEVRWRLSLVFDKPIQYTSKCHWLQKTLFLMLLDIWIHGNPFRLLLAGVSQHHAKLNKVKYLSGQPMSLRQPNCITAG